MIDKEKDAQRFAAIRRMAGYVQDGSHETVKISQDDATLEWIVRVGNRWWHGSSMAAAIDAAALDFAEDES